MANHKSRLAKLAADWSEVFPRKHQPPVLPTKQTKSDKRLKCPLPGVRRTDDMIRLKGLSVRQPWAEQIMRGKKTIEYRSCFVNHRGRIYIYASLSRYPASKEESFAEEVGYDVEHLPRGVVVGTVEITDCSDVGGGEFAWHLANPKRLDCPVPPLERPQPMWFHPFGRTD